MKNVECVYYLRVVWIPSHRTLLFALAVSTPKESTKGWEKEVRVFMITGVARTWTVNCSRYTPFETYIRLPHYRINYFFLWRSLLACTWIILTISPVLSGFQPPNFTQVLLRPSCIPWYRRAYLPRLRELTYRLYKYV